MQLNQVPLQYMNVPEPVLRANINSPQASAAGFSEPFQGFSQLWGARATVAQALRRFPQYNNVGIYGSTYGNSSYHSFQAKVDKRYRGGLSGTLAYTWSKFLTDARQFDEAAGRQNEFLREKSYHPTDLTHILSFSLLYELPFGPGQKWLTSGVGGVVLGGWQLATVNAYSSGTRLSVTTNNTLPYFNSGLRPDLASGSIRSDVGLGSFDPNAHQYLNREAFALPAPGQFGNAPRFLEVRGPGRLDESFALMKNTRIFGERFLNQFRLEVLNPLNRVVFGGPATNLSANNFGRVSSTQISPRQIQLGMKFIW
jgi:hypothetical protein